MRQLIGQVGRAEAAAHLSGADVSRALVAQCVCPDDLLGDGIASGVAGGGS